MSTSASDGTPAPIRAALVAIQLPGVDDAAFSASVAELHRLGRTLGVEVVATVTQQRSSLHRAAVLGTGKLAVLRALAGQTDSEDVELEDDSELDASDDDQDQAAGAPGHDAEDRGGIP